ncbi:MAG: hypothetical protein ACRD34_00070 [Bryobacteraceae bacterium]
MQLLHPDENKLIRSCLGSRDPYDRVWSDGTDIAAACDQLFCVIGGGGNWRGGVLGIPFTDFLRLAGEAGQISSAGNNVRLSRGSVNLTLPVAPEADFAWPQVSSKSQGITADQTLVDEMVAIVSANVPPGVQVTRFEMLGYAINKGLGYSLSLEALIQSKRSFATSTSLLLPTAFLKLLQDAIGYYKPTQPPTIMYNDRMVWAQVGRALIGAAVPAFSTWLDISKITDPLTTGTEVSIDLKYLQGDLALMQSLSRTITLSKAGVKCGAAHAWYEATEGINLPSDCALSTERLAALLPLTPKLVKLSPRLVMMEGDLATAYLATAGA